MRSETMAILLSLGLAVPAWAGPAQGTGPAQSKGQEFGSQSLGGAPALSPNSDQSASDQSGANNEPGGLQSEDALKQSLQKAGFSALQIAAGSYVVHAKGPDGKPVVMMITPDSLAVANPQSAELPDLDQNGDQSGPGLQNDQSDTGSQDQQPALQPQQIPQQPQND